MSIKSFAFGVVGAVVFASAAQGQSDCNGNRVSDSQDIADGLLTDCNLDGVPDNCAASQNLIANGSFENGTTAWSVGGHDRFTYADFEGDPIPHGNWVIDMEGSPGQGVVEQTISTVIGGTYRLRFALGRNCYGSSGDKRMQLTIGANAVEYLPTIPCSASRFFWDSYQSRDFTATASTTIIRFQASAFGSYGPLLDDVSVFEIFGTTVDSDGDGVGDICDNCPAVSNPSQLDCNTNGIGEACETFPDCNSNSLPDSCDITSGTSTDADSNSIPDSCQPDCNLNNLPDAWEIATGRATDYNADGIPDTCQGAVMVDSTTDNLGAPSGLATREHSFTALPFAESAVTITIDLIGDLNRVNEYVDVSLNGGTPRRFFEADGNDCPATPDRAIITLTRAEFNALISPNGGTGAILVVSMTGSLGVDSSECKNSALTQFRLQYVGIQAKSGDCNGNNRLDIAETHDGTTPDCNLNTVPDSCDIARGAAQDCNLNGVPDACELATTPELDCNTNGIIDSCDLATGGTTVDCDQNGRIDSCQVTETPGTDCNGNLRPDACDIASATSGDIDHNGTPDECQTVTVPGQYADIQTAIDAAPASEMRIISVAAGTYAGPIAFNGKPVIVRGASAASTVIDGASGQTLSVVRFNGGEPAIAALERVTLRGGITGTQIPSSPTVLAGGGIFGLDSAASVRDCVVEQNASGFGAGAYFLRCMGEVRGCTFRNNNASSDGGGFQSNQGTQQLTDVLIENNVCNSRGAGMHLVQGTPTLTRVTVRNNYSNNLIGGVSWYALGDATAAAMLDACVVTGNSALVTQGGIGISAASTGVPTFSLRASNVCNNTPRPNISGAWLDLGGNTICDCVGDLTLDGLVNGADLGILLAGWGACTGSCASDLNRDGVVNGADLVVLLAAWGVCGG